MIFGVGVDVVDIARFERAVSRTPALLDRLFSQSEQTQGDRKLALHSLAARFAAKEALIKAIGDSEGMTWHDMPIVSDGLRNPQFAPTGGVSKLLLSKGISRLHLTMSHDAGVAIAFVVAESE
ncbi:MAG: holo-ACP synthase [Microbacteriaceae bacterium]|nr:holo-ACP synthase [Microbacteriaceae bacterium]